MYKINLSSGYLKMLNENMLYLEKRFSDDLTPKVDGKIIDFQTFIANFESILEQIQSRHVIFFYRQTLHRHDKYVDEMIYNL